MESKPVGSFDPMTDAELADEIERLTSVIGASPNQINRLHLLMPILARRLRAVLAERDASDRALVYWRECECELWHDAAIEAARCRIKATD